jgi:hypothetical protein
MNPVRKLSAVAALAVVAVVVWAGPAGAAAGTATPDHVAGGGSVAIAGGGFKPNTPVDLILDTGVLSNTTTSAGDGTASVNVTAPAFPGMFLARLVGVDANDHTRVVNAVFSSLANDNAPDNAHSGVPGSAGNALAVTGAEIALAAGIGLLLVGAGWALARRGRARPGILTIVALVGVGALVAAVVPRTAARAAGTGSITGKVTASSGGAAVPNVCVHATSGSKFGSAVTNATGDYTISNLDAATYAVAFADCGADPTYFTAYNGGRYGRIGTQVTDGQSATVNASLLQGASLAGRATDEANGTGVGDVIVRMGPDKDSLVGAGGTTPHGFFVIGPRSAGTFVMAFEPTDNGHAFRYYQDKDDTSNLTTVTLALGDAKIDINEKLLKGGGISGKVTDAGTGAAPTRCVHVADLLNDTPTFASAFAGQDGTFEFSGLALGDHKVEFTDCEGTGTPYITQFFNNKPSLQTADPVAVNANNTTPNINAAMSTGGGVPSSSSTSTTSTTAGGGGGTTTTTVAGAAFVSNVNPAPGQSVTVTGGGFAAGSVVDVLLFSTPVKLGSGTADALGNVSITVTLPATTTPGAHTIQLQGIDPSGKARVLSRAITVVGTQPLKVTGAKTGRNAAVALALLSVGAFFVLLARRLRRGPGPYGLPY